MGTKAIRFSSGAQYVLSPVPAAGLMDFTDTSRNALRLRWRGAAAAGLTYLTGTFQSGGLGWAFYSDSGGQLYFDFQAPPVYNPGAASVGSWHEAIIQYDGPNSRLFEIWVDGTRTVNTNLLSAPGHPTLSPLYSGTRDGGVGNVDVAELAVYPNTFFSQDQVRGLYAGGGVPDSGLRYSPGHYWPLNGDAKNWADATGLGPEPLDVFGAPSYLDSGLTVFGVPPYGALPLALLSAAYSGGRAVLTDRKSVV